MSKVGAIWWREFKAFWYSPIAYIVLTVFLVILAWLFFQFFFLQNNADVSYLFSPLMSWALILVIPALTMRQWAEEKSSGTIELLMTQPLREWEAVLGKYLATVTLLGCFLALTLPMVFAVAAVSQNGLDWGQVAARYLGALLLGMAYIAIGGWVSSFTQNQIVALILGIAMIFALVMVGEGFVTFKMPILVVPWLEYLGLNRHYVSLARGVIDTRDLLYYFSMVFLFLYLTTRAVESRKWS